MEPRSFSNQKEFEDFQEYLRRCGRPPVPARFVNGATINVRPASTVRLPPVIGDAAHVPPAVAAHRTTPPTPTSTPTVGPYTLLTQKTPPPVPHAPPAPFQSPRISPAKNPYKKASPAKVLDFGDGGRSAVPVVTVNTPPKSPPVPVLKSPPAASLPTTDVYPEPPEFAEMLKEEKVSLDDLKDNVKVVVKERSAADYDDDDEEDDDDDVLVVGVVAGEPEVEFVKSIQEVDDNANVLDSTLQFGQCNATRTRHMCGENLPDIEIPKEFVRTYARLHCTSRNLTAMLRNPSNFLHGTQYMKQEKLAKKVKLMIKMDRLKAEADMFIRQYYRNYAGGPFTMIRVSMMDAMLKSFD